MRKSKSTKELGTEKNTVRIMELADVFKPAEYRRRSCEGDIFGFLTGFEKKTYLALPSGIPKYSEDKLADIERKKSKIEMEYLLSQKNSIESEKMKHEQQSIRQLAKKRL